MKQCQLRRVFVARLCNIFYVNCVIDNRPLKSYGYKTILSLPMRWFALACLTVMQFHPFSRTTAELLVFTFKELVPLLSAGRVIHQIISSCPIAEYYFKEWDQVEAKLILAFNWSSRKLSYSWASSRSLPYAIYKCCWTVIIRETKLLCPLPNTRGPQITCSPVTAHSLILKHSLSSTRANWRHTMSTSMTRKKSW